MESEDYHFKFKILIIGDKSVGKTSLLNALSNYGKVAFSEQSDEMNIKVCRVLEQSINYHDEETIYRINYWEIPSRLRSVEYTFRYCLGGTAAIYIFDVTKRQSFQNIEKWVESNQKAEIPVRVLIGNKVDLYSTSKDAVQKNEAMSLAKRLNMEYFEACSIGGDTSVTPIFDYTFSAISNSIPNPPTPQSLVGKGILLGKKLLNSTKYHLALCDIATLYE